MKKFFMLVVCLAISMPVLGGHFEAKKLAAEFARNSLVPDDLRLMKHRVVEQKLHEIAAINPRIILKKVGQSVEGRSLNMLSFGTGETRLLLWSQMHGDEPTATAALLAIFNFLAKNNAHPLVEDAMAALSTCGRAGSIRSSCRSTSARISRAVISPPPGASSEPRIGGAARTRAAGARGRRRARGRSHRARHGRGSRAPRRRGASVPHPATRVRSSSGRAAHDRGRGAHGRSPRPARARCADLPRPARAGGQEAPRPGRAGRRPAARSRGQGWNGYGTGGGHRVSSFWRARRDSSPSVFAVAPRGSHIT